MNQTELIQSINLFLFDMDGTLYLGNHLFDFTKELLDTIKATGRRYMFITNNSSKSVADYIKKLDKLGIAAEHSDFLTSSQVTSVYLKNNYPNATLYVCGTESLKEEFRKEGFNLTDNLDEVECVVMGFDTELTFKKLEDVSKLLLTRPELPYIATNPDLVCPTEYGSVPDCGSVCEMIFNATGKRPFVIGKPAAFIPERAMKIAGYTKEETAVIGDRIYTDIKSGINAGAKSILVMSGETTEEILNASPDKPDLVLADCSEITKALKQN